MYQKENVRVLIAEDNFLVREMTKGLLKEVGLTVVGEAINGLEAVELTERLAPDVVLMDIEMSDINGLEAAQYIQKNHPTPVVILTAYETQELVKKAGAAGVGAYLVKPPNAREMERAITIAIARFEDMVELRRLNAKLQEALDKVKTLSGLLPICANCKRIRDDEGYWQQVEVYIRDHSDAEFSHGICPDCATQLYPDFYSTPE
jgi:AmiR/NasT family two-component response regulator